MARISTSSISKIFDTVRIEEIIGDFVQLKRAGSNLRGLSPFTQEKTPSFYVVPSKQIFKDFSSGKGGTAVTFLMEYEQMTYPEALRYLAKRYGIDIEEDESPNEEAQMATQLREQLFLIQDFAKEYFKNNLWHTEKGRAIGLSYFQERGFEPETIRKFDLGYSFPGIDGFIQTARNKGYADDILLKAGLIQERQGKGLVDLFRGRVIFPIHSLTGRIVGFGGRILESNLKAPKYVNSPETEIYHKGKLLYGLYQARKHIVQTDKCYVVEGYTDVLSMHQAGIENTVSTSGTALTTDQIRLIKRLTSNITFLFDGDPAGIRASLRGIDLVLQEGIAVKIALLPDKHDPDSFAKAHGKHGVELFLAENERDFIRFRCDLLKEDSKGDPIVFSKLIGELINSIALIPNDVTQSLYLQLAARETGMEIHLLQNELYKATQRLNLDKEREARRAGQIITISGESTSINSSPSPNETHSDLLAVDDKHPVEKAILELMLQHGYKKIEVVFEQEEDGVKSAVPQTVTVTQYILEEMIANGLEFRSPEYKAILRLIEDAWLKGKDILTADDFIQLKNQNDEPKGLDELLAGMLFNRYKLSDWGRREVYVRDPDSQLYEVCKDFILRLMLEKLDLLFQDTQISLETESLEEEQLQIVKNYLDRKQRLKQRLNWVVSS